MNEVTPALARLHDFWREQRMQSPATRTPNEPVVRTIPKIGRNAPCPCGSGRKYKKCCGSGSTTLHRTSPWLRRTTSTSLSDVQVSGMCSRIVQTTLRQHLNSGRKSPEPEHQIDVSICDCSVNTVPVLQVRSCQNACCKSSLSGFYDLGRTPLSNTLIAQKNMTPNQQNWRLRQTGILERLLEK